jgi:hypothetical protein
MGGAVTRQRGAPLQRSPAAHACRSARWPPRVMSRDAWWAQQGSNLRRIGYEPTALPLSYGPALRQCTTFRMRAGRQAARGPPVPAHGARAYMPWRSGPCKTTSRAPALPGREERERAGKADRSGRRDALYYGERAVISQPVKVGFVAVRPLCVDLFASPGRQLKESLPHDLQCLPTDEISSRHDAGC